MRFFFYKGWKESNTYVITHFIEIYNEIQFNFHFKIILNKLLYLQLQWMPT